MTDPAEKETLRWLHLSDFHFTETEDWGDRLPLRALLKKLETLEPPDLVFLTGDIAFSGKPKEYDRAHRFFDQLATQLDLAPEERFFLAPGNHDVDRTKITRSHRAMLKDMTSREILDEYLRDADSMRQLGARMLAFYEFTGKLLGKARTFHAPNPWRTDVVEVKGWQVAVMQLNDSWSAGTDEDRGKLMIGRRQLLEQIELATGTDLRFALCHHPFSYLRDYDETDIDTDLSKPEGAYFLLRGHLHRNRQRKLSVADEGYVELAAGAVTEKNPNYTGFMTGTLTSSRCTLAMFSYSDGADFWAEDTKYHRNAKGGVWSFP